MVEIVLIQPIEVEASHAAKLVAEGLARYAVDIPPAKEPEEEKPKPKSKAKARGDD